MSPPFRGYSGSPPVDPLELRSAARIATDLPVSLHSSELGMALAGRTRDLSIGGLCVATAGPFVFKSVYQVTLQLPDRPRTFSVQGCWQREEPADDVVLTGLNFDVIPAEDLDALWEVVLDGGKRLARFLHEHSDLAELGLEEAMALAQVTRYRDIPAARPIYRQGATGSDSGGIFLLVSGIVTLQLRARDAIEIPISRLEPGALFGGMPLLAGVPHTESAVAESDVRLLEIDASAWRYLRIAKPWIGHRLGGAFVRATALRLHETLRAVGDRL